MSSNLNDSVAKVTGSIASVGGLDRATAQLADTSFLAEIVGTGDALTITAATVGACGVSYLITRFKVVDLDEL